MNGDLIRQQNAVTKWIPIVILIIVILMCSICQLAFGSVPESDGFLIWPDGYDGVELTKVTISIYEFERLLKIEQRNKLLEKLVDQQYWLIEQQRNLIELLK